MFGHMAAPEPNHYAVLELTRSATEVEIRAAYRRLARQHHPDANPGDDAEHRMRRINEAWETLRDPQRRSLYDRQLPLPVRRPPVRTVRRQPAPRREAPTNSRPNWFAEDTPREAPQSSTEFTGDPSVDWYATLGVRPGATRPEILKALSRMAEALNGAAISATEFTRRKTALREAWVVLGNQYTRAAYDRARKVYANQPAAPQSGAASTEAEASAATAPPAGYRPGPVSVGAILVDKGCDLRGVDLRGADLRGLDLAGIDLREARLQGVDFEAASLRKAKLAGADLTGASLKHADLSNADCQGAHLRQADLSGAALYATSLFRANLSGSSLANSIGPGVNLDYANLARADFTGARITPQLITRGKLEGTIMPDGTIHA